MSDHLDLLIAASREHELRTAEQRRLDGHLAVCARCAALARSIERNDSLLAQRERPIAIRGFEERAARRGSVGFAFAAVAAVILAIVFGAGLLAGVPRREVAEPPTTVRPVERCADARPAVEIAAAGTLPREISSPEIVCVMHATRSGPGHDRTYRLKDGRYLHVYLYEGQLPIKPRAPTRDAGVMDVGGDKLAWAVLDNPQPLLVVSTQLPALYVSLDVPLQEQAQDLDLLRDLARPLIAGAGPVPAVIAGGPIAVASLEFVSEQVGWVATHSGPLYRMRGTGWVELPRLRDGSVELVDFVGTQVGWGVARYTRGQYGCAQAAPPEIPPCRSALLHTQDGGETWEERLVLPVEAPGGSFPMQGLAAIDDGTVWLLVATVDGGYEARLTTDGGRSWRTTLARRGLNNLIADGVNGAWVIASTESGAEVLRTTDSGRSWVRSLSGKPHTLSRVGRGLWALERDGAYCTSSNCSEYKLSHSADGGASWTDLGNPKNSATCTGGHLGTPSFSETDGRTGYIPISLGAGGVRSGDGGLLLTNDGGRTWRCETTPPNVTRVVAVMGTAFAVSHDRVVGTESIWRRVTGGWTRTLP